MMALSDFMTDELAVMDKVSKPDGFGGFVWTWQEGARFTGAAVRKSGSNLYIAQQQGMKETYSITTQASVVLERGDIVKRLRDGATLRVTTAPEDGTPPNVSDIKCLYVLAERVTL